MDERLVAVSSGSIGSICAGSMFAASCIFLGGQDVLLLGFRGSGFRVLHDVSGFRLTNLGSGKAYCVDEIVPKRRISEDERIKTAKNWLYTKLKTRRP